MSAIFKKILVPTDFTVHAEAALVTAADFARKFDASLIIYHVVDVPSYGNMLFDTDTQSPDKMAEDFAADQLKELRERPIFKGLEIQTKVGSGRIFSSIIDEAEQQSVDLIVMGTHGLTGLEQMVLGTNARRVIHLTSIPVLTVKNPLITKDIRNVAFASNFNQEYSISFPSMYQYIESLGAHINMVKVITRKDFETTAISKRIINDFAAAVSLSDYQSHIINANTIEEGLAWFCEEHQIDLLFMPTHGKKGFSRIWSGSHTAKMGQESTIPVFSLKMIDLKKPDGVIFPE